MFGALLTLIGDMILGWGVEDETLTGISRMLSAYTGTSDGGILAAALLGLFGITLEGLCYFGIYRLIVAYSPKYAHSYRAGIFGYVIFGGCGFHVPVCAMVFLTKHGFAAELVRKFAAYFVLPAFILFWIFFLVLVLDILSCSRRYADHGICKGIFALSEVVLDLFSADRHGGGNASECVRQLSVGQCACLCVDQRG